MKILLAISIGVLAGLICFVMILLIETSYKVNHLCEIVSILTSEIEEVRDKVNGSNVDIIYNVKGEPQ